MNEEERMYLDYIVRQNKVLLEQVSVLSKVIAKHLGLAIEESEEECEYINADERISR